MRIAPPLFVAGDWGRQFFVGCLGPSRLTAPLWAFLVLGAALASCLVCRGKSREARSISRALRSLPAAQLDGTTLWGEHATAILTIRCQRYPTQIELDSTAVPEPYRSVVFVLLLFAAGRRRALIAPS
jgi:hypothetical protein